GRVDALLLHGARRDRGLGLRIPGLDDRAQLVLVRVAVGEHDRDAPVPRPEVVAVLIEGAEPAVLLRERLVGAASPEQSHAEMVSAPDRPTRPAAHAGSRRTATRGVGGGA